MSARKDSEPDTTKNHTTVEPKSECEIVVTRTFDAPARIVFEAWTTPALFKRWWVPKSMPLALLSYEADIRTGGGYRLVFDVDGTKTARDAALASGAYDGMSETFGQLDEVLVTLGASAGAS